ncbi:hypothetical protein K7X08_002423 [Anisodus acutangulus]|uniref:Uncharacterized protein n=1 Tax=Anisodus acutangulus TaxID=402998 RepID=A0A9Q1LPF4_9SOLA|nr:hypothetical protein K7X08_002423 [Anisodus acutangulus]
MLARSLSDQSLTTNYDPISEASLFTFKVHHGGLFCAWSDKSNILSILDSIVIEGASSCHNVEKLPVRSGTSQVSQQNYNFSFSQQSNIN